MIVAVTLAGMAGFDTYAGYLDDAARAALARGDRVILGLRVATDTRARDGRGRYDDRIVVLWRDASGRHVREFAGNTDPSAYYETVQGQDSDGDGRLDLGRVPSGSYTYVKGTSAKLGDRVLRSSAAIRSERDTNHDGRFGAGDVTAPGLADRLYSDDFLFHPGLADRTGSAGCQTLPPEVYDRFWASLGDQHRFTYVLVHVGELPGQPG